jgi:hypothetical protein
MQTLQDYVVTNKLCDVATEIQRSSFAVLQVSPNTAQKLTQAWRQAVEIMNQTPHHEWTKIVDGHLHGYHVPSRAKRLFRAFPFSGEQPWPDEDFRKISQSLAGDLHEILLGSLNCLQEINSTTRNMKFNANEAADDLGHDNKRPRIQPAAAHLQCSQTLKIDPARCPLDYFLYLNKEPKTVNCSEHVDRGLLIAVSLTDVPGLEVLVRSNVREELTGWICPETRVHNSRLYEEASESSISDLICIMAGGQLAAAIGAKVPPCVHRVRQMLKRSRLSISYELRATY